MNVSLSPIGLPVAQLVRVVPLDRASSLELSSHIQSVANEIRGFTSCTTLTSRTT